MVAPRGLGGSGTSSLTIGCRPTPPTAPPHPAHGHRGPRRMPAEFRRSWRAGAASSATVERMVSGETLKAHQAYYKGDSRGWQQAGPTTAVDSGESGAGCSRRAITLMRVECSLTFAVQGDRLSVHLGACRAGSQEGVEDREDRGGRDATHATVAQPAVEPAALHEPLRSLVREPQRSPCLSRVEQGVAGHPQAVTGIRYEWSPGRRDPKLLGNGTAFDVYIEYTAMDDSPRFLGIEVKYHEDLGVAPPSCVGRPQEVFETSGVFAVDSFPVMSAGKNAQILLDHLLALSVNAATQFARKGLLRAALPRAEHRCIGRHRRLPNPLGRPVDIHHDDLGGRRSRRWPRSSMRRG